MTILNSAVCFIAAPAAAVTAVSWLLTFTPWATWRLGLGKPVRAVPDQDGLGAA